METENLTRFGGSQDGLPVFFSHCFFCSNLYVLFKLKAVILWAAYSISIREGKMACWIAVLSSLIAIILLVLRGRHVSKRWISPPATKLLLKSIIEAQLDFLAFLSTVAVLVTILRAKNIISFISRGDPRPYRLYVHVQMAVSVAILLCTPLLLVIAVTVWRIPATYRAMKITAANQRKRHADLRAKKTLKAKEGTNQKKRDHLMALLYVAYEDVKGPVHVIFQQTYGCLIDAPLFALLIPVLLSLWRAPSVIRELYNTDLEKRRRVAAWAFYQWLCDLPFVCMLIVMLAAPWRMYILYRKYPNVCRYDIWEQFINLVLLDTASLLSIFLIGVTIWRISDTRTKLKSRGEAQLGVVLVKQALEVIRDLPFFLLLIPIIFTIWHAKKTLLALVAATPDLRRDIALVHFIEWLKDLPYIVMFITVTLTLYRLPPLLFKLRRQESHEDSIWRVLVAQQMKCLFCDVPVLVASAFVFLSRWHWPTMQRNLQQCDDKLGFGLHRAVFPPFMECLYDSPYFIAVLLLSCSWRAPWFLPKLWRPSSLNEKRSICREFFIDLVLDVPAVLCAVVVFLLVWNASTLKHQLLHPTPEQNRHKACFSCFKSTVKDFPYIMGSFVICITLIRAPLFLFQVKRTNTLESRKNVVFTNVVLIPLDVIAIPALFLLLISLWCTKPAWGILKSLYEELQSPVPLSTENFLNGAMFLAFEGLLDIPCFLLALFVIATVWNAHKLCVKIRACEGFDRHHCGIELLIDSVYIAVAPFLMWRIPSVLYKAFFQDITTAVLRRKLVSDQLHEVALDLPYSIISIFLLLAPWRVWFLFRNCYQLLGKPDTLKRKEVVAQTIEGGKDLACFCMLIITTLSWRGVLLWIRLFTNIADWRDIAFTEFKDFLFDLPYLPPFVLVSLLSFWRLPAMFKVFQDKTVTDSSKRTFVLAQFKEMISDYTSVLLIIVISITLWRAIALWRALLSKKKGDTWHSVVFENFQVWKEDAPYAPLFVVLCFVAPWRVKGLTYNLLFNVSLDTHAKHRSIMTELKEGFLDHLSLLQLIVMLVTLWRVYPLIRALYSNIEGRTCRTIIFVQFREWLQDTPYIPLVIVLFICMPWRIPSFVHEIRNSTSPWRNHALSNVQKGVSDIPAALCVLVLLLSWRCVFTIKSLWFHQTETSEWTTVAFSCFWELMYDLPWVPVVLAMGCFFPWRLVHFFFHLKNSSSVQRRDLLAYLMMGCKDYPAALKSTVILCTVWYLRRYLSKLLASPSSFHALTSKYFIKVCLDMPYIMCLGVSIAVPWRTPLVVYDLYRYGSKLRERRYIARTHIRRLLYDPLCIFCFFFILLTAYRLKTTLRQIYNKLREEQEVLEEMHRELAVKTTKPSKRNKTQVLNGPSPMQWALFSEFKKLCTDLLCIAICTILAWRLPSTISRMRLCANEKLRLTVCLYSLNELCEDLPYTVPFLVVLLFGLPRVTYFHFKEDKRRDGLLWCLFASPSITSYEKRMAVAATARLAVADLLCFILSVPILITMWRAKSAYTAFTHSAHKHQVIVDQFFCWISEVPYASLVPLMALFFPWRLLFLAREKRLHDARAVKGKILHHFFIGFADIFCFALLCLLLPFPWRIVGFYRTRKLTGEFHMSVFYQVFLLLSDAILFVQILFIIACVIHVPPLIGYTVSSIFEYFRSQKLRRSAYHIPMSPNSGSPVSKLPEECLVEIFSHLSARDIAKCSEVSKRWYNITQLESLWRTLLERDFQLLGSNRSSRLVYQFRYRRRALGTIRSTLRTGIVGIRAVTMRLFIQSVHTIPHSIALPLKLLGLVIGVPIIRYHQYRARTRIGITYIGVLTRTVSTDFWHLGRAFFEAVAIVFPFLVLNEISFALSTINFSVLYIITLGARRPELIPMPLLVLLHCVHSVAAPFLVLLQIPILILPELCLCKFYGISLSILELGRVMSWSFLLFTLVWTFMIFPVCEALTIQYIEKYFVAFSPGYLYWHIGRAIKHLSLKITKTVQALYRAFAHLLHKAVKAISSVLKTLLSVLMRLVEILRLVVQLTLQLVFAVLGANNRLLAMITHKCFLHGQLGNILLTPACLAWVSWPLLIPLQTRSIALGIPATVAFLFLTRQATRVVSRHWRHWSFSPTPQLTLESLTLVPVEQGNAVSATLLGTKPASLSIKAACLCIKSKGTWAALDLALGHGAVSFFRAVLHPVRLSPGMFPTSAIAAGSSTFRIAMRLPVSKPVLLAKLEDMRDRADNATLEFVVEFGEFLIHWEADGVLFKITATPNDLLRTLHTNKNLLELDKY
ncbi:hypothetical protein Pelo_5677 [Pelomyxa schiedti]|nr:hypothetical protein Pelo_5677 [Pelomyxa schiedti]